MNFSAVLSALAAAALFGVSTPLAKLLLGAVDPWLLAGLFYLGSGLGLAAVRMVRPREPGLVRRDLPWIAGAVVSGGVIGPVLLMIGLATTEASTASLLLTAEGVATALIAWFVFRENFDRRIAAGLVCIVIGAAVLAWQPGVSWRGLLGPLAIIGACVAWGVDNNLTRPVALASPSQIAMIKGLVAGTVNLLLATAGGAAWPGLTTAVLAGGIGFVGYGLSIVLFIGALRHLGAARTGAYFATAPFLGAAGAVLILGEPVSLRLVASAVLMAAGVWLHLTERHEHEHEHGAAEHEHRHVHDTHHQHAHAPGDPAGEPHSHRHAHGRLRHSHAHMPDSHHQHSH